MATLIMATSFALLSLTSPAPSQAQEVSKTTGLAKIFQQKADSFMPKGSVFFLTRTDLADLPALTQRLMDDMPKGGFSEEDIKETLTDLKTTGEISPLGATKELNMPRGHGLAPFATTFILPNAPDADGQTALSGILNMPENLRCQQAPFTAEDLQYFTMYHEWGHALQNMGGIIPESDNELYTVALRELHSDICGMVGKMAKDGNQDFNIRMSHTRSMDSLFKLGMAHMPGMDPDACLETAVIYENGAYLDKARHILQSLLDDKALKTAFDHMDHKGHLALATQVFHSIVPDESEFAAHLESLTRFRNAWQPDDTDKTSCLASIEQAKNSLTDANNPLSPKALQQLRLFVERIHDASTQLMPNEPVPPITLYNITP